MVEIKSDSQQLEINLKLPVHLLNWERNSKTSKIEETFQQATQQKQ